MSKNKILLIVVALAIIIGGGLTGYFLFINKKTQNNIEDFVPGNLFQKEEIRGDLTYEDSSGFSFKYPNSTAVTDITPQDDVFYTSLKLSKGEEYLTINVKDTIIKTPDDWILSKDAPKDLKFFEIVDLGGISAKQYSSNSKIVTIAIDKGVLYLIEGINDKSYWKNTHQIVTSTFAFADSTVGKSGGSAVDNTIYEEEEVVE